jgi:protein phosphatase
MVRAHNEDRFGIYAELGLFVVADGMGGHASGEVAAQMAVEHVCKAVADPGAIERSAVTTVRQARTSRLVAAIERANHEVYSESLRRPELGGMGTTIAAVLATGGRAAIAHIGDSRVYRLRGRTLDQLTEDHSLAADLIRMGLLDPQHAHTFERRNVITRALGTKPSVDVDTRLVDVGIGDTLLLCTDGICGVLSHCELAEILTAAADLDDAVQQLVARANDHGGPDNATAVAIRWESIAGPFLVRG